MREPQQDLGRGGVAAGDRVVREVLRPDHERLRVVARLEEAAALGVAEPAHELVGQRPRVLEPPELEGRLVQDQARIGHRRVIVRERGPPERPSRHDRRSRPSSVPQVRQDELGRPHRRLDVPALAEHPPGLGERADRHPVPGREHLVVGRGVDPSARGARTVVISPPRGRARDRRARARARRPPRRAAVAATARWSPPSSRPGSRRTRSRPPRRPPRRARPTTRRRTGPRRPRCPRPGTRRTRPADAGSRGAGSRRSGSRRCGSGRSRDLPRVHVEAEQERVVVEHLLEVRDEPSLVGRVAVEPAAELVVHAAAGHPVERRRDELERVRRAPQLHPQAELQRHRLRELRRPPNPPQRGSNAARSPANAVRRTSSVSGSVDCPEPPRPLDRLGHLRALRLELRRDGRATTSAMAVSTFRNDGHAVAVLVREVRPGEEGPAVGRQERRQRPAAAAGHRLHGVHVDRVQVGPLLAVDLDRDEVLVHQGRRLRVLERLSLHHVAPVAGRVPDRQQDRLVLRAGAFEGLLAPGEPVHGVRGVLQQVRARLVLEAVHGRGPPGPPRGDLRTRGPGHVAPQGFRTTRSANGIVTTGHSTQEV